MVYAREMTESIININQEVTSSFLTNRQSDSMKILKELSYADKSLQLEKNNITEPGEDKLVSGLEVDFNEYHDSVLLFIKSPVTGDEILYLQDISASLHQHLLLLSQMNGKALEVKTDDAKANSKSAVTQMTILATFCFLIGMSFTFSFASYFNQRFFQLYNGIKEIVSSNYDQKLFFIGKDEFYEISLVLNEMAENLKKNKQKLSVPLQEDQVEGISPNELEELRRILFNMKVMEEQASAFISRFEKK